MLLDLCFDNLDLLALRRPHRSEDESPPCKSARFCHRRQEVFRAHTRLTEEFQGDEIEIEDITKEENVDLFDECILLEERSNCLEFW